MKRTTGGDICKIDETQLPHYDLITYSSPCQDFSVAGKQAGGDKGSGTRSSLLWECERIIREVKPKYLLMENVKALTSKKFMPLFQQWLKTLEKIGYQNHWKVLNAKDYGVPQNRERLFVVSIRKDIECDYKFPAPVVLTKRLKDVLEQNVDEKYYLPDKFVKRLPFQLKKQYSTLDADVAGTETSRQYASWNGNYVSEPKVMQEPMNLYPNSGNPQAGRVYNANGISPAMDTCQGGNRMPKIVDDTYANRPPREYEDCCPTIRSERSGFKVQEYRFFNQAIKTAEEKDAKNGDTIDAFNQRVNKTGVCPTLTTRPEGFKTAILPVQNCRIRKLTPRECWRLMGVKDEQFDKLHDISNSQLYKMAGNSIVVDVLMAIFKNLFEPTEQIGQLGLL